MQVLLKSMRAARSKPVTADLQSPASSATGGKAKNVCEVQGTLWKSARLSCHTVGSCCTQYAYPDHIKTAQLTPEIAPNGGFTDARDYRGRFPDGRIGSNPALATPEDGEVLAKACGERSR